MNQYEMRRSLVHKLLEELECVACGDEMTAPLVDCASGHHLCNTCLQGNTNCPVCSTSLATGTKRDYLLEKLCFNTIIKCSFQKNGCKFSGTCVVVARHETICQKSGERKSESVSNATEEDLAVAGPSSIKEEGRFLEEVIISELECPICLIRISPPFKECVNGHRICNGCFERIEQCPVCRGDKNLGNGGILEYIFFIMEAPCKYVNTGCDFKTLGLNIENHEIDCSFITKSCPLSRHRECKWEGFKSEMINHCKTKHFENLSLEYKQNMVLEPGIRSHRNLFCVYDEFFMSHWVDLRNAMSFGVYYLGEDSANTKLYYYSLEILMPDREIQLDDPIFVHQRNGIVNVSFEDFNRLRDSEHKMNFRVSIFKKGVDDKKKIPNTDD